MRIRVKRMEDQAWVEDVLRSRWGATLIAAHDELIDAAALPALVAGARRGLATTWRRLDDITAELVTLDALEPQQGIGTTLIGVLVRRLRVGGIGALRVTTTNDNLAALRFYQRRGFHLSTLRPARSTAPVSASPRSLHAAPTASRCASRSSCAWTSRPLRERAARESSPGAAAPRTRARARST